ncbi:hypothetical protein [Photorhabdus tasmaniensis]|nr:hypothetical protein [Photorhabdus tasmaniensis]
MNEFQRDNFFVLLSTVLGILSNIIGLFDKTMDAEMAGYPGRD